MDKPKVIIIGGGAAGFFTALQLAETRPDVAIVILERGKNVLEKVRISGGGRCNVTHACFEPMALSKNYPRGERELIGPFSQFNPTDTIAWFKERGVELKAEADGRMFPVTDRSETIINCFLQEAKKHKVHIETSCSVQQLTPTENGWLLETTHGPYTADKVVIATGSNPKMWTMLEQLGHRIVAPVPSLFTFNCNDAAVHALMGVAVLAETRVRACKLTATGPVLFTHWGLSGPGILRLSAWGARWMHEQQYQFELELNWLPNETPENVKIQLQQQKSTNGKKELQSGNPFGFPQRFWHWVLTRSGVDQTLRWADCPQKMLDKITQELSAMVLPILGKSTYKDEFVTAGGVELKEIQWKSMESKIQPQLYFAGEVLNVDAITGGFNFQHAWTGAFMVAQHLSHVI